MNFEYCEGIVHVVEEGDTLYQLSRAYEVPLALIMRANPYVDVYNLQVGSELCIPVMPPVEGPGPVLPDCPGCSNRPIITIPDITVIPDRPGAIVPDMSMRPDRPGAIVPDMPMRPDRPGAAVPDMPMRPDRPGTAVPDMPMRPDRPGAAVPDMPMRPNRPGAAVPDMPMRPNRPVQQGMTGRQSRPGGRPITMPKPVPENNDSIMSYVVKENDTLEQILRNFNVDLEDLLNFNNSNGIWLKPGATLRIPEHIDED